MPPSSSTAAADSLIRGRTKRSNAGNRMRELLDQEIESEEVFQEVEDDIDFQEKQDEEDIVDSDFGKSSDEEAGGAEDSEEEGERELQAEEKARRKATQRKAAAPHMRKPAIRAPKPSASAPDTAPGARRARSTTAKRASFAPSVVAGSSSAADASRSLRRSTQATSATISAKLAADEARRQAATPRARAPKRAKLTQDALIAEALETEERNRASLRVFLDREEERKARDRRGGKKEISGPYISWRSVGVEADAQGRRVREMTEGSAGSGATPAPAPGMGDLVADPVMADRAAAAQLRTTHGEPSTSTAGASAETMPLQAHSSTFASPDLSSARQSRTVLALRNMPASSTWADEFRALLGSHCAWDALPLVAARNRPLRPRQSTCAITGAPAIYRDPRSGVPFASAEAYQILTDVMAQQFSWTAEPPRAAAAEEEGGEAWRMGVYTDRVREAGANACLKEAREKAGVRRDVRPPPPPAPAPAPPAAAAAPRPAAPAPPPAAVAHVAPGWVIAPAFEVAPGDEKAIVAAALALPSGTTRSGGRRSAAAGEGC